MKKTLLALAILLVSCSMVFAQEHRVSGKVTGSDGSPLPGITIQVKGTNTGTATDATGNYGLSVPDNATLIFHGIGFEDQSLEVGSRSTINVIMKSNIQSLSEYVVVGYGTKRQIGSVVGSISNVSQDQIKDKPSPNVLDALQGEVPGMQIFTSSGEPSETPSIRIHGVGSLGASSTPLFLLDGIPIDAGTLNSLNPNDIASMTVLKDASATSIYGARAANGVVYITTKSGTTDGKGKFTITAQHGVSNLANTDFFNQFMSSKQLFDFWVATGFKTQQEVDALAKKYPYNTKWYKTYYRKDAPMNQLDASFSGGNQKTSYFFSGSYLNQDGIAYRSGFERYTLRSNVSSRVNDWLRFGANIGMGYTKWDTNPYGSNSTNRGLAMLAPPYYPSVDSNGHRFEGVIPGWGRYDPRYLADKNPSSLNRLQFNPTGYVEITPVQGLTLRSQGGIDWYDYRSNSIRLPSYAGSLNDGSVSERFDREYTATITNTAEYKFNLNADHAFTILAGQEYITDTYTNFNGTSSGQTDDRLILLSAGTKNKDVGSTKSEYAYSSYFGRVDYNYQSKYFLTASIRNDGSSRFGKNNRYATFWSVGGMWKVQKDFLNNVNWLSDLSLKVSYGTNGNSDIGNYESQALVGTSQYDSKTGWNLSSPGNPNLEWETQKQANFGLSFDILKRGHVDLEYYNRITDNMLVSVPFPYTSGFANVTQNVGSLKNSGFDVQVKFDVVQSNDFYISPYVNFTYNKNKVTELFQGKDLWVIPNTGVAWVVGQPVMFYQPIWAGVDPKTGAPQWYKPDPNDPAHTHKDPNDVTSDFNPEELQQPTGQVRQSPFNGGFGVNAGYKGFYLRANFSFYLNKYLFNNGGYFFENANVFTGFNMSQKVIGNFWTKPGDHALYPDYDNYEFMQFDSRLIQDASFMRLKILEIGYQLPDKLLRKTNTITGARIFFTGRNLLTFTKYPGPDPEVDSNLALGTYPNTKQVVFGIQLQF